MNDGKQWPLRLHVPPRCVNRSRVQFERPAQQKLRNQFHPKPPKQGRSRRGKRSEEKPSLPKLAEKNGFLFFEVEFAARKKCREFFLDFYCKCAITWCRVLLVRRMEIATAKNRTRKTRNLRNQENHPPPCPAACAALVKKRRPVTRDRRADPTTRETGDGEGFEI